MMSRQSKTTTRGCVPKRRGVILWLVAVAILSILQYCDHGYLVVHTKNSLAEENAAPDKESFPIRSQGIFSLEVNEVNRSAVVVGDGAGAARLAKETTTAVNDLTMTKRRTKLHVCDWWAHNGRPTDMLRREFHFDTVNALKTDDWDLIFGGYPHCGKPHRNNRDLWDWKMEAGLNAHLNRRGWENLKPHQIWFPCMGGAHSFCDKRELCRIQRRLDPQSCFLLPDDQDELLPLMDGDRVWVLKRDAPTLNLHLGHGVSFIQKREELPDANQTADETYLVQTYQHPFLGEGLYKRKSEIRFYLSITSTSPLRAYAYSRKWVSLSSAMYEDAATTDKDSNCMRDSHVHRGGCGQGEGLPKEKRVLTFKDYASKVNLTHTQQEYFTNAALQMLGDVIGSAQHVFTDHIVNKGIRKSGASCFSYMRADFGATKDFEPVLFEINEFPFANEKNVVSQIQEDSYRELFLMIGLDQPPLFTEEQRAEYEAQHNGNWILLSTQK